MGIDEAKSISSKISGICTLVKQSLLEFGYFPLLVSALVGSPSLLVILESIFIGFELSRVFQWAVDGWIRLNTIVSIILDPFTSSIVGFIRSLGIDVHLQSYWQSVLWLLFVPLISFVRTAKRQINSKYQTVNTIIPIVLIYAVVGVPLVLGSIVSGLAPPKGDWVTQGIIASLPIVACGICYSPFIFIFSGIQEDGVWTFSFVKQVVYVVKFLGKSTAMASLFFWVF